jgi:hypothetical protein
MNDNYEHFRQFMVGFTAAAELHQRASKNGSLVECVCLGASVIDAALRVGLVLQHQLATGTTEIARELVIQEQSDKQISEREIYRRAKDSGLIDETLFNLITALYNDRNRVIHRYVISRITTAEVFTIARSYEAAFGKVSAVVGALELKQIQSGIGMTKAGPEFDRASLEALADEKHTPEFGALLRGS